MCLHKPGIYIYMACSPLTVYAQIAVSEFKTNPDAILQPVAQLHA